MSGEHIIQNWGPIKYLKIELQNPFANFIFRRRWNKYAKKWNSEHFQQEELVKTYEKDGGFKVYQLVKQEIEMWIRLGKQVCLDDFIDICVRRGFNAWTSLYLKNMLKYVGIGDNLI